MIPRQRIVRVRREYNQWVANQTLEDYSLRFTAKSARRWSAGRVANTALGAISFLALEAIGGTITLNYGVANAVPAILLTGLLIFLSGLPIAWYAARYGVDIDLLTRGAGFGYIGSTVTSLIYASFTFIFFAIEAVILASVLESCFGLPPWLGYVVCSIVVIPLVTHGITFISRFQRWTQPLWVLLQVLPFPFIAWSHASAVTEWKTFPGVGLHPSTAFDPLLFGAAASVVFSLVAQIGEQVDFLRFLPVPTKDDRARWWTALIGSGPGWIVIGVGKLLAGSFLAFLALRSGVPEALAARPAEMYQVAFGYVVSSPGAALIMAALFVGLSQIKINVTNAYAGSIAWSNFFSRLTHSHPGRVVWLVFNVAIALMLMEIGIYQAIEHILSLYAHVAAAWVGALVADLVVNKPLGFSPPYIEFKRAHLYDINPVGIGAMVLAVLVSAAAHAGMFGVALAAFTPFLAFAVAFAAAPLIAIATRGRFYLARKPRARWADAKEIACCICEHPFEPEDMAHCPIYSGPICSLCCSLDARCEDKCKPRPRVAEAIVTVMRRRLPVRADRLLEVVPWRFLVLFTLLNAVSGAILFAIAMQAAIDSPHDRLLVDGLFQKVFFILTPLLGVASWLLVLAQRSSKVAREESRRQTTLLLREIRAHERTDEALQKAKEAAEAANLAKSRYVVGLSHELRTPLNAILGYAQLLERDPTIPERRRQAIRMIRRGGDHLAGLIEGLLDIARIEAGRIQIDRDQISLPDFLEQLVGMFAPQAEARGVEFRYDRPGRLPPVVHTDEKRLRQILINLLSNALKFTDAGTVTLRVRWQSPIAVLEVSDTGPGIAPEDQERIFEPFERAVSSGVPGIGLGLTIVRLLTRILGGELILTSTPGQGSTFRVRLMLSETGQTPSERVPDALPSGYSGPPMTIMVVDDDAPHRGLIKELLSPLGFDVRVAADGPDCLRQIGNMRIDLFLLDISMPGMDGWELARRLRVLEVDAPIVMVSANASGLTPPLAPDAPHDGVITKPISIPAVLSEISRLTRITWRVTDAPPTLTLDLPPNDKAPPGAEAGALNPRHLDDLHQLATIGYVRGIQERLKELRSEAPEQRLYLDHLESLIDEFRLPVFLSALNRARRDAA